MNFILKKLVGKRNFFNFSGFVRKKFFEKLFHKKGGKKRLKGEVELVIALGMATFLALLGIFIITRNYYLQAPEILRSFLRNNKIQLSPTLFQSQIFPYPHLYAEDIELLIDNSVLLQLKKVSLSPDYLSLLLSRPGQIRKVQVEKAILHVLKPPPEKVASPKLSLAKIKEIVISDIIRISHIVIRQFLLAQSITITQFTLFVADVSEEFPLVIAKNFYLNRSENVDIELSAYLGAWLKAKIQILGFLKKDAFSETDPLFLFSHLQVKINHTYDLQEIGNFFQIKPFPFKGRGDGQIVFELPVPVNLIEGYLENTPFNVEIGTDTNLFKLNKSNKTQIAFHFFANENEFVASRISLKIGDGLIWPQLNWNFEKFLFSIKFPKNTLIAGSQAGLILGDYFTPFLQYLTTEKSYLKPNYFFIYPLEKRISFETDIILSPAKPKQKNQLGTLALSGRVLGNEKFFFSEDLVLKGENTALHLRKMKLSLGKDRKLYSSVDGDIYLRDFYEGTKGSVNFTGFFVCSFPENKINCERSDFSLVGSDIQIPVDNVARLYRILSIDVFSYWKSLKKNSEITIKELNAQGYLENDTIFLQKSLVDSDTGRIQITGHYKILSDEGHFVLRLLPFGVDRMLDPIPVIGTTLKSSISLAAQMIYDIRYEKGSFAVERFTMGTGFEQLRKLFRN